jgi:arylsulfatase A-like enzyme
MSGEVTMTNDDWDILTGLYDTELAYVDMRLGQLYDYLAQSGLLDNTILIITADHGENLGDHGLMDHQYCVYDTLVHVPLIIRYSASFPARHRETALVQTLDLFPTIAKLLGRHNEPSLSNLQGQSLLPEDLVQETRPFTVTEYLAPQLHTFQRESIKVDDYFARQLRALRTDSHKFIWASDGQHELYDLTIDPREKENLITIEPARAADMEQMLQEWIRTYSAEHQIDELIDEAVVSRLEALGYIEG